MNPAEQAQIAVRNREVLYPIVAKCPKELGAWKGTLPDGYEWHFMRFVHDGKMHEILEISKVTP
jgi:hypothetical protein